MKAKLFYILSLAAILCACDTPSLIEKKNYAFFIFRFTNEANKELIITCPTSENREIVDSTSGIGLINGIHNCPKRYKNEPYYCLRDSLSQNPEKYIFDICELATEEKLLTLHDGYYTYFPYTAIIDYDQCVVRDGKWESVCESNPMQWAIHGSANALYKDIRLFEIQSLEKITGKSRKEMTIDDIEKAVNIVIDKDKLDKYSRKCNNMWMSHE